MPKRPKISAEDALLSNRGEPGLSAGKASDITPASPSPFPFHKSFQNGISLGTGSRLLLVAVGLFLLAGFGLSARLSPDPRGHGTHQQLGLAPCSFLLLTGMPCPSCGGTTAFAHFVRGEWPSAVRANAAAFCLALACAVALPWCWVSAARSRLVGIANPERAVLIAVITFTGLFALQWGVNVFMTCWTSIQ